MKYQQIYWTKWRSVGHPEKNLKPLANVALIGCVPHWNVFFLGTLHSEPFLPSTAPSFYSLACLRMQLMRTIGDSGRCLCGRNVSKRQRFSPFCTSLLAGHFPGKSRRRVAYAAPIHSDFGKPSSLRFINFFCDVFFYSYLFHLASPVFLGSVSRL